LYFSYQINNKIIIGVHIKKGDFQLIFELKVLCSVYSRICFIYLLFYLFIFFFAFADWMPYLIWFYWNLIIYLLSSLLPRFFFFLCLSICHALWMTGICWQWTVHKMIWFFVVLLVIWKIYRLCFGFQLPQGMGIIGQIEVIKVNYLLQIVDHWVVHYFILSFQSYLVILAL
jgi:hypothetical protein